VIVRLVDGIPGLREHPELYELLGLWVVRYEPENYLLGEQWLWTTDQRAEATRFDREEWREIEARSIGTRPDGKPDRPITVFYIEISTPKVRAKKEAR
jgi:hypothetical protein